MVTFRKDIHLGRRVPMTPKDKSECMLVNISEEGIAVDKYGRKWQFVAFEERTVMPIIEIVDVTTDATMGGFDPVNYPRIAGKKGGVYRITITEGEEDCTLWYKILKYNEELDIFVEPSEWTQYTDPVVLKTRGRYCIKAYASQDGHKNSLEVQSDNFQVTQRVLKYNYAISIGANGFVYNDIPANGGTVAPKTLSYNLVSTVVSTDPNYSETQGSGSGATAVFSGLDADPNTGELTWEGHNDYAFPVPVGTVYVTLNYEIPEIDRYGVDPATDYVISAETNTQPRQLGKEDKNNIYWDNVPPSTITAGDSISFKAHADEGTVTFEDGEGNAIESTVVDGKTSATLNNVQNDITIVAKVAATTHYTAKSSSKMVRVSAPATLSASGVSNTVPTTASSFVANPNKTINFSGQSGKVYWVAIPSSMSISSWYDNDESYEMKNEIDTNGTFIHSGESYTIHYTQLLLGEQKNYTIRFS